MININNTPWEKLSFSDIQALLDGFDGETFFFEIKSDEARNQTLHKEISAFANTYGGYASQENAPQQNTHLPGTG